MRIFLKVLLTFGDDTFCWETNQLCQRPKPKNDMVMMAPDCGSFEGLQKPAFLRRWNTNSVNRGQKILCANVKYYFRVKCSKGNYFCFKIVDFEWAFSSDLTAFQYICPSCYSAIWLLLWSTGGECHLVIMGLKTGNWHANCKDKNSPGGDWKGVKLPH